MKINPSVPLSRSLGYLFRFLLLFEINRFQILEVTEKKIKARIGWSDYGSPHYDENDEVQDIEWDIQEYKNFNDALEIAEYLIDHKLMRSDQITINKDTLNKSLGWEQERYENALNTLLGIRVDMLDDGKKTDYYFIHF